MGCESEPKRVKWSLPNADFDTQIALLEAASLSKPDGSTPGEWLQMDKIHRLHACGSALAGQQSNDTPFKIYTDGGARDGDAGKEAGAGLALVAPGGELVFTLSHYIGKGTNNEAEYHAVIDALTLVTACPWIRHLEIHTDSQLVQRQVQGGADCNASTLKPLCAKVRGRIKTLRDQRLSSPCSIAIRKVKGHSDNLFNNVADYLATRALTDGVNQREIMHPPRHKSVRITQFYKLSRANRRLTAACTLAGQTDTYHSFCRKDGIKKF